MFPDALDAAGRVEGLSLSSPQLPHLDEEEDSETSAERGPKRRGRYRKSLQLLKPFRITHKSVIYLIFMSFNISYRRLKQKCTYMNHEHQFHIYVGLPTFWHILNHKFDQPSWQNCYNLFKLFCNPALKHSPPNSLNI